ncbi:MAG: alpha-galactosidase [Deltaproteobacteria bacterium]|nr:alpha-galactosidase [Deltaproteobacteria bacterium]
MVFVLPVLAAGVGCGGDDDDDDHGEAASDDDAEDDDTADDDAPDDDSSGGDEARVYRVGDDIVLRNRQVMVRYHLSTGRFDIRGADGETVVENAETRAQSNVLLPIKVWRSSEKPLIDWSTDDVVNNLGRGKALEVLRGEPGETPDLAQRFEVLDDDSIVLTSARVLNDTGEQVNVGSIYTMYADGDGGAFYFGAPEDIRVLSNGALNYLEFITPIFAGIGPAHSNWSALVHNRATGGNLVVGSLSNAIAQSIMYYAPGDGVRHVLHVDCQYDPSKHVADGGELASEVTMFDLQGDTPFDALEAYADRIKTWNEIVLWNERHPDKGVPAGWNSWSGSKYSGGYGTGIDEDIIVANMDFADDQLRRWGFDLFPIDDGWEVHIGDWQVNKSRFPDHGEMNGIEWLLRRAKDRGFRPGLWIEATLADKDAQILVDHPEYFADPLWGGLLDQDERALDLTDPVALAYLKDMIATVKSWGIEWLKFDFGYRAVLSQGWHENATRGEFYRNGTQAIREAVGDDVFFLNVAIVGWNYGLVDAVRLTLDTMPAWDGENPSDPFGNQGLKPMYRDVARRYYLHNRTFINHPDLIFFRAHIDESISPLSLNESAAFATAVAMQGGIVKLGDKLVDLSGDAVDVVRRLLPVHGEAGRPLDMLEREFPEVWSLPIPEFDEPYHILGLFNWGMNRDLTTLPYAPLADAERTVSVSLDEAGLDPDADYHAYEFWTESYLGTVSGEVSMNIPARHARVVALREKLDRPQFLGTNRHVLGGVEVIDEIAWDAEAKTLTGTQEASVGTEHAPFAFHLAFFAPDGYEFDDVAIDAPNGLAILDLDTDEEPADGGAVVHVAFTVEDLDGEEIGDTFEDLTWTLSFQ